ncbi:hypothetical protein Amet_0142 [Alkaliphilus metalliredigens QYMF]|uniref:Sporulation membrane protein YtrI C-terminal domain-containing protein n=1 Tax=Alkaliphilus metalliredigens (strain QYMF) TaxID=293826 RepID=A6TJL3_ALKMQ|nr:hypothetical protein [Alkaliphilus metalliredigens]ABR46381.1 hypothetical protein Amet_0142 [Alkaliphilus metalliredigens QYMF]
MKGWTFYLSVFLIGFLMGLGIMNLFQMHTLDRLYRTQNQLTSQLLDQELKLERLNENLKSQQVFVVKDLSIVVDFDGNPLVQDEIENNIRFYLSDLVGRELSRIDGEMIYKIVQDRILHIGERQILLEMKYIIIEEKIQIGVKATVLDK